MNGKIKVFVYGTLMSDRANHSYLSGQELLGIAKLEGYEMYNVSLFPGIVPKQGEHVLGELYEIDEQTLKRLDRLEGEGYMYKREKTKALLNDELQEAYTYVWLRSVIGCRKVETKEMPWKPVITRR